MATTAKQQAQQKLAAFLTKTTDKHLAMVLEVAITGETQELEIPQTMEVSLLRNIEPQIRAEARKRVGDAAHAVAEADWDAFAAKWGLDKELSDEQMDAIYDTIPDGETPNGEWFYLVRELRKK